MADRPKGGGPRDGSPDYHWLYGSKGGQPSGDETRAIPQQSRDDETRVMPAAARQARGRQDSPPPAAPPKQPAAQPAKPAKTPRRRPHFRARWLWVVLVLWLVFLVAIPFWAWSRVDKVNAFPSSGRPDDQPGTTYLMVGSDSRSDLTEEERKELGTGNPSGNRTDTIMLLHTGDGPNLLMSIPRDSIVSIPGYGDGNKINAAYAYGGAKLLVRTIEAETGIRVDHFVEVGFGGFVDLVDAVGGIEVCPTQAVQDKLAHIDIPKGCQEVDGPTALGYARSRHAFENGDLDRARHQREVVSAIGHEAVSPWSIINPIRYYRLNMAGARAVRVSEGTSPFAMAQWALAMTRVDGDSGLTCGVPVADFAVNWDEERSEQMFTYVREDKTGDIPADLCTPTGFPKQ